MSLVVYPGYQIFPLLLKLVGRIKLQPTIHGFAKWQAAGLILAGQYTKVDY
jgi:hypothetical protein